MAVKKTKIIYIHVATHDKSNLYLLQTCIINNQFFKNLTCKSIIVNLKYF